VCKVQERREEEGCAGLGKTGRIYVSQLADSESIDLRQQVKVVDNRKWWGKASL